MEKMKIEEIRTRDLIPYGNNPRISDAAVEAVAASIKEFGFKVPIVIDKNNVIVCGHTRLKAAEKLGLDGVPAVRASDLSESQIREFRLIDNKTGELAMWNFRALKEELDEIMGIDMRDFGFLVDEIKAEKEKVQGTETEEREIKEIRCPRCGRLVAVE